MTTTTKPIADHGTLSRYKYHGCRCGECVEFYRAYRRTCHRKQGYGTWQPYVDAEPVRQHLLALHEAGLSYRVIAEHLGKPTPSITAFIYDQAPRRPRRKRATPELANAILAVQVSDLMPGMIDATGSGRRLRALAANGWPMQRLAPYIGIAPASVNRIANQKWVFRPTARSIADTYEQLRNERPEDHDIPAWLALKTRNWAARNGWQDPLWWEDMGHIDDPSYDPATAEREPKRDELAALRRAEVEHLARFGLSLDEIDKRVDLTRTYIRDIVRELHTGQRRDRTKAQQQLDTAA